MGRWRYAPTPAGCVAMSPLPRQFGSPEGTVTLAWETEGGFGISGHYLRGRPCGQAACLSAVSRTSLRCTSRPVPFAHPGPPTVSDYEEGAMGPGRAPGIFGLVWWAVVRQSTGAR